MGFIPRASWEKKKKRRPANTCLQQRTQLNPGPQTLTYTLCENEQVPL